MVVTTNMNDTLALNPHNGSPINPAAHEIGHGFGLGDWPTGTKPCVNSVMPGTAPIKFVELPRLHRAIGKSLTREVIINRV
jgi:hypothetical protein